MVCPIGEPGSETRARSDAVLEALIKPAVEACGYSAIRADEIARPGLITSQVIQHLMEDDLVVADLSEGNPNVYYELAVRHAAGGAVVQIIDRAESPRYDLAGMRTIRIERSNPRRASLSKDELVAQIRSLETNPDSITPITPVLLQKAALLQNNGEQARLFADTLASLADRITMQLAALENVLKSQDRADAGMRIDTVIAQIPEVVTMSVTNKLKDLAADGFQSLFQEAAAAVVSEPKRLERVAEQILSNQMQRALSQMAGIIEREVKEVLHRTSVAIDNRIDKAVRDAARKRTATESLRRKPAE